MLFIVEPSLRAMKFTCLLPRLVLTQPLISTSFLHSPDSNKSFTDTLFVFILLKNYTATPFPQQKRRLVYQIGKIKEIRANGQTIGGF